jgi:phospholipid N-methyltransferase
MTLNEKIKQQYADRANKSGLYNSVYSDCAEKEKEKKTKKLLSEFLKNAGNKTVLEIGAGQGGNVPLLRECGFKDEHIYLNELLTERILAIRKNYPGVHLYAGNALDIDFNEKYDCIFQSTVFTSILKQSDRQTLAGKMWELLKPGGIILWYDFVYNNPNNPDVRKVPLTEVKRLFPLCRQYETMKVTLAPPIGRKVGRLYSFFNLPFLRSHILGAFQKS